MQNIKSWIRKKLGIDPPLVIVDQLIRDMTGFNNPRADEVFGVLKTGIIQSLGPPQYPFLSNSEIAYMRDIIQIKRTIKTVSLLDPGEIFRDCISWAQCQVGPNRELVKDKLQEICDALIMASPGTIIDYKTYLEE